MFRSGAFTHVTTVLLLALSAHTARAMPPNDQFVDAETLADAGTWVGSNSDATKESGEPLHAGNTGGASIWFRWISPLDGFVTVDTFGSGFDTLLAMYTGAAVDALTAVASDDDTGGRQSQLANVPVTAGTVYHFAVDGYNGATGAVTLNWSASEQFDSTPPTVIIIDPDDGLVLPQGGELIAAYLCRDETGGSGIDTCIGDVADGEPIDTSIPGEYDFTVTATDLAGNVGAGSAAYTVIANPANDDFVDAQPLAVDGSIDGTNAGATVEAGEPAHAGRFTSTSVWFSWVAPADGFLSIDTIGSGFDTILAMYTGTAVDTLSEVAANDNSGGSHSQLHDIAVTAGISYSIAVTGRASAFGLYALNWTFMELNDVTPPTVTISAPANDAILFQGVTVLADYDCVDEPLGSGLQSCIGAVESGQAVDTSTVGVHDFAVTGTDNWGNTTVETNRYTVVLPANDDFANALTITGSRGVVATNAGASREPGEPDHAGDAGGASIWFRLVAASDGFLTVDTFGSDFDTTLGVYTGVSVDALTELGSSNDAGGLQSEVVDIAVVAGGVYYIAVDGVAGATGQVDLAWLVFEGPAFIDITPDPDPLWVTDAAHDFWLNSAAPADVDGDGDLDLAVIGYFVEYGVSAVDRLVIFVNEGPGAGDRWNFSTTDVPLVGIYAGEADLAWGDFDNDGDPDLAVGSEGATVLYRNDAGNLVPLATDLPGYFEDSGYTGAYDLRSLTWADYDNDADLDLLIPSTFDEETFTFGTALVRNDGSDGAGGWTFTVAPVSLDATVHAQTAWADHDSDGDLDLFMANVDNFTDDGYVRLFNNNAGTFAATQPLGTLRIEYGLGDWSDYDGDGDLDILIVGLVRETDGSYATVLRIYDNTAGVYTPNTLIESSFFPWLDLHAATWADYDSDGDVDILVTGTVIGPDGIEGRSTVFVNEAGAFIELGRDIPAPVGSSGRGGTFTWFDVDGDADLDYFVAGSYYVDGGSGLVESKMNLFRNDSAGTNDDPAAPTGLAATVSGETVSLSWAAASDDATAPAALTYDLEVQPAPVSLRSGAPARHRLPEPGSISAVTHWTLQGLPPGRYVWRLSAVDSAFNGGPASEGTFEIGAAGDFDADGVPDGSDNCLEHANVDQRDTDGDGYGNRCDPDFNNDEVVNFTDLAVMRAAFFGVDAHADLDGDGMVNFSDLAIFREFVFGAPGPAGGP